MESFARTKGNGKCFALPPSSSIFETEPLNKSGEVVGRPRPTAISLFAGAGGCSLGFGQAGYTVRFATDIDADAVESYRRNFPRTPCEAADVRQLVADA